MPTSPRRPAKPKRLLRVGPTGPKVKMVPVKWKPHPEKIALDKWECEHEGLFDPCTLGSTSPRTYLTNRLHKAFKAGWEAAESYQQQLGRPSWQPGGTNDAAEM